MPLQNGENYIKFYINDSNQFYASDKNNNLIAIQNSPAAQIGQYGIDIHKVWYLSPDVIMLMWSYTYSATQRGIVYMKIFDLDGATGKLHGTAARAMFPSASHKLDKNSTLAGYTYSGRVFPFHDNGQWNIGIQYMRNNINASKTLVRKDGWCGYIGVYVLTTSLARLDFQRTATSRLSYIGSASVAAGADLWFDETRGNIISWIAMTSASIRSFTQYMSGEPTGDAAYEVYRKSNNPDYDTTHTYRWLNKLDDDSMVIHDVTDKKLFIYNVRYVRTNDQTKWIKVGEISLPSDLQDIDKPPILLKSNILIGKKGIYQFTFSNGEYGLSKIGEYTMTELSNTYITDNTDTLYGHYCMPVGIYSNYFEGIGGADVVASTT